MDLKSMTGFARSTGATPPFRWVWELKAVNAKGLDLRLRLPPGFDSLESEVRGRLSKGLARGACHASLSVHRDAQTPEVRINRAAIAAIMEALRGLEGQDSLGSLSLDGLLAVRGVVDLVEGEEGDRAPHEAAFLAGLNDAIEQLTHVRAAEGRALGEVLRGRLVALGKLVEAADALPVASRTWFVRASLVLSTSSRRAPAFLTRPGCIRRRFSWPPRPM